MLRTPKVIRDILIQEGTSLYTLVGTRIWNPRAIESWTNTETAIVFDVTDRPVPPGDLIECSVDFECFGGSRNPNDTSEVYEALFDLLHSPEMLTADSGSIVWAELQMGDSGQFDDRTEWYSAIGNYTMKICKIT